MADVSHSVLPNPGSRNDAKKISTVANVTETDPMDNYMDIDMEAPLDLLSPKAIKTEENDGSIVTESKKKYMSLKRCIVRNLTLKRIGILIILILVMATLAVLVARGYIDKLATAVDQLGAGGYVIFFFVIILIVQPFGWGYTPAEIALGFLYEWNGLALLFVSCFIGSVINFIVTRRFSRGPVATQTGVLFNASNASNIFEQSMRDKPQEKDAPKGCYDEEIEKLEPKTRLFIRKLDLILTPKYDGTFKQKCLSRMQTYPTLVGCRWMPALPFGMVTVVLALTHVSFIDFCFALALGIMCEAPVGIYLGTALRGLNNGLSNNENNSTEYEYSDTGGLELFQLALSLSIMVIFLIMSIIYGGYVYRQVSKASDEEVQDELREINKRIGALIRTEHFKKAVEKIEDRENDYEYDLDKRPASPGVSLPSI